MENRLKKIFTVLALTVMLLAGWASLRFLPSFDPAADEADLNDDLILRRLVLAPSKAWNAFWGKTYFPDGRLLIMEDGRILAASGSHTPQKVEKQILQLRDFCEEHELNLLYVILPPKYSADEEMGRYGIRTLTNWNLDRMDAMLEEDGISHIDMRKILQTSGSYDDFFYKTDHHWNTDAGLLCARTIAERLNDEFGCGLDTGVLDETGFEREVRQEFWVGETGEKTLGMFCPKEDLILLSPLFETDLTYWNDKKDIDRQGSFGILTFPERLTPDPIRKGLESAYYYYLYSNDAPAHIKNRIQPEGNVLLIKDSFAIVVAPYLSLTMNELTLWDMRSDPAVLSYLLEHPEIRTVVIAYNPGFLDVAGMYDFQ